MVIYGLIDEIGAVRYVGQTKMPVWRRLAEHVASSSAKDPRPVLRWLYEVYSSGSSVRVVVLQDKAKRKDESKWIKKLFLEGSKLLNIEHCGTKRSEMSSRQLTDSVRKKIADGVRAAMTPEVRARISAGLRGIPKTAAHKAAISAATKGRDNWNRLLRRQPC